MCASLFYVVISRLAAEHIIKNTLGAVLIEGEAGLQHFLGAADHETDLVVGSADEVLEAGFVIDEDSPEDIMDVFGTDDSDDADTYEE